MRDAARGLRWAALVFLVVVVGSITTLNRTDPKPRFVLAFNANLEVSPLSPGLEYRAHLASGRPILLNVKLFTAESLVAVDNTTSLVSISSLLVGYLLSLWAALRDSINKGSALWYASLALSALGVIGFLNEALRVVLVYDVRLLISSPLLLVIVNWLLGRAARKACEAQQGVPGATPPLRGGAA
jgi:hypothetical protein